LYLVLFWRICRI